MAEEGEKEDGEETETESKERDGEVEEGEEKCEIRKPGRVMELPRVKYWEDRRVTIYISGFFFLSEMGLISELA